MQENLKKLFKDSELDFGCVRCGNCCVMEGYVFINMYDIETISSFIGIAPAEFKKEFIQKEDHRIRFKGKYEDRCAFYEENKCEIYPVRPKQCKTFPVWLENLKYEKYLLEASRYCKGLRKVLSS